MPAAHKWDAPSYQSASKNQLSVVQEEDGVNLRLASGEYDGIIGPIKSITPVISIIGEIKKSGRVQFSATPGCWTLLYIVKGSVCINNESIAAHNLVVFEKNNDEVIVTAEEDTQLLFLSAEPINEPVAAKDNFVMNTAAEIEQAMDDYKKGIFGTLIY